MKPTHLALYAFAAAGIAVALLLHHKIQDEQAQRDAALQQVQSQIKNASAEQARLAAKLERQNAAPSIQYDGEVARLKEQAQTLRARTNEMLQQKFATTQRALSGPLQPAADAEEAQRVKQSKMMDAMGFSVALLNYMDERKNTMPSRIEDLTNYLSKSERWSGSNHFELIFHGSMDRLKGLPWGDVAVARSEPWMDHEGVEYVAYSFLDGHSQLIRADRRKDYEAKHVFDEPEKR